jgi:hypothetical protein
MNSKLLLPYPARWIGLALLLPAFALGIANVFFDYEVPFLQWSVGGEFIFSSKHQFNLASNNNLTDEIALTCCVIGLLLVAFSRERKEDEFIGQLRLESLQWAVLVNYVLLVICTWLIYGTSFFIAMIANLLTVLIIFNIRFHWLLRKAASKTELP